VIVRGEKLIDFMSRTENVLPMQPDLQAEIEFGLDNSEEGNADLAGLLESFFEQDEFWQEAERDIGARALAKSQQSAPGAEQLELAAALEVQAWQAAWRGDLEEASNLAGQAADELHGEAVAAYRCLWMYLAASWSTAGAGSDTDQAHALSLRQNAEACARHLSWRPRLMPQDIPRELPGEYGEREERAVALLLDLGLRGLRFEKRLDAIASLIADQHANSFEEGLRALGELLGFESVRPTGSAQPDGAWRDGQKGWFVFEAKTEESAEDPVSPAEVRQALTHPDWISNELGWERPAYVMTCLVSAKSTADRNAAAIAAALFIVHPEELERTMNETVAAYRAVRARASGLDDQDVAREFAREFRDRGLETNSLATRLATRAVKQLRTSGDGV
jgi:hypothetical protein